MEKYKDFLLQVVLVLLGAGCLYGTMNNKIGTVEAKANALENKFDKSDELLAEINRKLSIIQNDIWWMKKQKDKGKD